MGLAAHHDAPVPGGHVHHAITGIGTGVAVGLHEGNLLLELVGHPDITGIEESNPAALGLGQGGIAVTRLTSQVDGLQNAELIRQFPANLILYLHHLTDGAVLGGIIDEDEFPVGIGLGQDAPDAFFHKLGLVVGEHDDGD